MKYDSGNVNQAWFIHKYNRTFLEVCENYENKLDPTRKCLNISHGRYQRIFAKLKDKQVFEYNIYPVSYNMKIMGLNFVY